MITKEAAFSDNLSETLFSVLVHDLRHPFATLIMTVDMLKHTRRSLSPEELMAFFDDIRDMSFKNIDLLDGLICWMKSKKEGFTCRLQPLLLNDLIDESNNLYLHSQTARAVSFHNNIPADQLIFAHKQMLQFVNRNIISNATKYSPNGGVIEVNCFTEDNWLNVAFADQGSGMTTEEISSLFTPAGIAGKNQDQLSSAGIALNICQDLISQMNGRLWVESIPGNGCTFYYSLPCINS